MFGGWSESYSKHRPSYPPLAINTIVHAVRTALSEDNETTTLKQLEMADLACGSGKASLLYAQEGGVSKVHCIDHDVKMLDECSRLANMEAEKGSFPLEKIKISEGTAEKIPLESHSLDFIAVHQAFHWFRAEAALREIHRCLKPNGFFVAAWNDRDLTEEWVSDLEGLIEDANPKYKREMKQSDQWGPVLLHGGYFSLVAKMDFTHETLYNNEEEIVE